ncbi:hypothetical protein EHO60_07160 [Leptospira fletcheri]|uniref:Lipoprotein n=1 Tax=Leptospira fletcheri TaxID=2484981 RepID=A0A4R9GIY0_9LEPT|nr:hypothetical protein [Leptospira fletcheri]TGK12043.1 hypothetical protein EHO60_07160 [Leptospira fletcheri]
MIRTKCIRKTKVAQCMFALSFLLSACTFDRTKGILYEENAMGIDVVFPPSYRPQIFYPFGTNLFENVKQPQWALLREAPILTSTALQKSFVKTFSLRAGIRLQNSEQAPRTTVTIIPINLLISDGLSAFVEILIVFKLHDGRIFTDRFSMATRDEFPNGAYTRAFWEAAAFRSLELYRLFPRHQDKLPEEYLVQPRFSEEPLTYFISLFQGMPGIKIKYFNEADAAVAYLPNEFAALDCLSYANDVRGGVKCTSRQKIKIPVFWSLKIDRTSTDTFLSR